MDLPVGIAYQNYGFCVSLGDPWKSDVIIVHSFPFVVFIISIFKFALSKTISEVFYYFIPFVVWTLEFGISYIIAMPGPYDYICKSPLSVSSYSFPHDGLGWLISLLVVYIAHSVKYEENQKIKLRTIVVCLLSILTLNVAFFFAYIVSASQAICTTILSTGLTILFCLIANHILTHKLYVDFIPYFVDKETICDL